MHARSDHRIATTANPGTAAVDGGRKASHIISSDVVYVKGKGKGFAYSIPSVGPGVDPGVQAVSSHVTISHPPGGRLPLLSARPAVTFPAAEHQRPLAGTKLYIGVNNLPKVVTQRCPEQDLNP